MRRIAPVLLVVLGLSACTFTTSISNCANNTCSYTLNGAQAVDVEIGGSDRRMEVGPIESSSVEVSMRGEEAELAEGESADLDGLTVTLISLEGEEVKLLVSEA
jgi:hypothetical protein